MFDFRLKVFYTVCEKLNFTKAAEELNITQPAVSKHIKEIEQYLGTKMFERSGSKVILTEAGEILRKNTAKLFAIYRELELEINLANQKHKGHFHIGASTTIAQYLLPPFLAAFHRRYREISIQLTIQNTEAVEQLLAENKIDIGLIEGASKNRSFQYLPIIKDEIVLVARSGHPLSKNKYLTLPELTTIPLLMREPGSGTHETITRALKDAGVALADLQCEMQLGNTESIKSYLLNSDCMAFISIHSVLRELREGLLTIIDVEKLTIEREFQLIRPHGHQSPIGDAFVRFVQNYNF